MRGVTVYVVDVVDPALTATVPVTALPLLSVRVAVMVPVSAGPPDGKVTFTETAALDVLLMELAVFVPDNAVTAAPSGATADRLNAELKPLTVPTVAFSW